MSSIDLTNLVDLQVGSSAGVSPIVSIKQWSLTKFDEGTQGGRLLSRLSSQELSPEMQAKLRCVFWVIRMPSQGVPELCETVKDIYEFYQERAVQKHNYLPKVTQIIGTIGESQSAAEFSIDYNE